MKRLVALVLASGLFAAPIAAQDIPLSKILVEKESWREAAKAMRSVTYLKAEREGSIGICQTDRWRRLDVDGTIKKIPPPSEKGVEHRYDNAWRRDGDAIQTFVIAFIPRKNGGKARVIAIPSAKPMDIPALKSPACLTLWPDEGHLVIGESDGAYLWAVRIEKDGSFGPGDRYYSLRTKPGEKMHVSAMTMDAGYLLYACTPLGIQVFDPTGRLSGVIAAPSKEPMTAITIGGVKADELFVAAGDKIFARKIHGKASYTLKKDK